jgi:crotonobetainyl-CoA:carnitine CoA-transferase CaiB-like acyl-CoA transferase
MEAAGGMLAGFRVLDMSRVMAGPMACQMLADLGAEVIKIEQPKVGDKSRFFGPPFLKTTDGRESNHTPMYTANNRNKRSIAIDIAQRAGSDVVRRLAAKCDVLVENYKVGDLARFGLDYESIRAVNADIVYCSITGFGQTGPYRHRLTYDPVFQAMSGIMDSTGHPDGVPGGGPMRVGAAVSDVLGGLYAGVAIVSALLKRERDGGGDYIDMSLLDCSIAGISSMSMHYLMSGTAMGRYGTGSQTSVPGQAYPAADGHVYIFPTSDADYRLTCEALDRPDLASSERYRTKTDRVKHRQELVAIMHDVLKRFTVQEVVARLEKVGVPAAPIYTQKQVFEDPQVIERGMVVDTPHPWAGRLRMVANPIRFRERPITEYAHPPSIGEHTREILSEVLQLDAPEIDELIAAGVVATA